MKGVKYTKPVCTVSGNKLYEALIHVLAEEGSENWYVKILWNVKKFIAFWPETWPYYEILSNLCIEKSLVKLIFVEPTDVERDQWIHIASIRPWRLKKIE